MQALSEDPGRNEEEDAGHLEKMTDYKSYSKVILCNQEILLHQDQKSENMKIGLKRCCPGLDGHCPSDGKCKPAAAHIGDLRTFQVSQLFYNTFDSRHVTKISF